MEPNLQRLCRDIGYHFKSEALFLTALTHRSYKGANHERLEYLGDSILNFVIAAQLFKQFDSATEGQLTQLRANLVNGKALAKLAKQFSIGELVRLGRSELRSGGHCRDSILADTLEAVIGAIYLEAGLETISECILVWYKELFASLSLDQVLKDPKTQLQEYTHAKKLNLPEYKVLSITGKEHDQTFEVSCVVADVGELTKGEGSNRRSAERVAAKAMLTLLGIEHGK